MEDMKEKEIRKIIGWCFIKNYHVGKRFPVKHFLAKGASKDTIYRIIQRYEEGLDEDWNWSES